MRILVSGATGLVGSALTTELSAAGDDVIILTRGPRGRIPDRSEGRWSAVAIWSPLRDEIESDALEGLDAVVHLAGENVAAGRWSEARKARIRDSRVRGTALLAAALASRDRRPRVLVCASAVGYYGDRGDAILTEASPPSDDFLGRTCVAWEAAAEPARQAGIRVVHARLGVVLSRRGGALARMLPPFRLGLGGRVGSGRQYMSWLTLAEAVGILRFALDHGDVRGAINAVSPQPVTNAAFTRSLGNALGRPAALPLPSFLVRLLFGEMGEAVLLASTRARPARLQELGYAFRHPELSDALAAVLQEPA